MFSSYDKVPEFMRWNQKMNGKVIFLLHYDAKADLTLVFSCICVFSMYLLCLQTITIHLKCDLVIQNCLLLGFLYTLHDLMTWKLSEWIVFAVLKYVISFVLCAAPKQTSGGFDLLLGCDQTTCSLSALRLDCCSFQCSCAAWGTLFLYSLPLSIGNHLLHYRSVTVPQQGARCF